jgi:hypothetical protein
MSPDFAEDQTVYLLTGSDNLDLPLHRRRRHLYPAWWLVGRPQCQRPGLLSDFAQDQTLFALAVSDGLYRSTDGARPGHWPG